MKKSLPKLGDRRKKKCETKERATYTQMLETKIQHKRQHKRQTINKSEEHGHRKRQVNRQRDKHTKTDKGKKTNTHRHSKTETESQKLIEER